MTLLADICTELVAIDWTPWLAITRRQLKFITLLVIGGLLLATAIIVAFVILRRVRRKAEGLDEPVAPDVPVERPEDAPPPPRVVDAAIANLLEQAAPVDGDERSEDELFASAVEITVSLGGVSIPALQRKLHLGFDRATELVNRMVDEGMLTEPAPGGKRKVTPAAQSFLDGLG